MPPLSGCILQQLPNPAACLRVAWLMTYQAIARQLLHRPRGRHWLASGQLYSAGVSKIRLSPVAAHHLFTMIQGWTAVNCVRWPCYYQTVFRTSRRQHRRDDSQACTSTIEFTKQPYLPAFKSRTVIQHQMPTPDAGPLRHRIFRSRSQSTFDAGPLLSRLTHEQ